MGSDELDDDDVEEVYELPDIIIATDEEPDDDEATARRDPTTPTKPMSTT